MRPKKLNKFRKGMKYNTKVVIKANNLIRGKKLKKFIKTS